MVNIFPEEVDRVMCHIIAYWTNEDPNSEIVCAVKKRLILLFQV